MTNNVLVQTALRVLRRPGIMSINFELAGLLVTGMRFVMVSKAIEDGNIKCQIADKANMNKNSGLRNGGKVVLAKYISKDDTIYFPREDYGTSDGFEQSVIVHESVHAMFDLYAKGPNDSTIAWNDECAAVLAAAYFLRLCEPLYNGDKGTLERRSFTNGVGRFGIDELGHSALMFVDDLMKKTGDFNRDRTTLKIKLEDIQDIRNFVAHDWEFTVKQDADGGVTDSRGIKYPYQGVTTCNPGWWNKR